MSVKCYDVVESVIEEATKQFHPVMYEVPEGKAILRKYCSLLDRMADTFNGIAYTVEVDDITTEITLSITCDGFVIEDENRWIYELFDGARAVTFRPDKDDEDHIEVSFRYEGIWKLNRVPRYPIFQYLRELDSAQDL